MIFAAFPFVTIFAFAYVFVESILTNTTVETGLRGAFINVGLAPRTIESTGTLAFVASHHINAVTAILTRIARALVNVDLAVSSSDCLCRPCPGGEIGRHASFRC